MFAEQTKFFFKKKMFLKNPFWVTPKQRKGNNLFEKKKKSIKKVLHQNK